MHENSVYRMVGYVMGYYKNGAKPSEGWSLVLNFNRTNQTIVLEPSHFSADGLGITDALNQRIADIDPGYQVRSGHPVFMEAATRRKIPIPTADELTKRMMDRIRNPDAPKQEDFYSVIKDEEVFSNQTN